MATRFTAMRIETPDPLLRTCVDPEDMRTYLCFDRGNAGMGEKPTVYLERGFGVTDDCEDYGHGPIVVEIEGPDYRAKNGIAAAEFRRDGLTLRFTPKAAKHLEDDGIEVAWDLEDEEFEGLREEVLIFFSGCKWFVDHSS